MKNKIYVFTFLLAIFVCKAQVIGTLEQFEECNKRPNRGDGCPDLEDITYVKDTHNRLNQFVGTWKGSANGKQYEIQFEKKLQYGDPDMQWDRILGRMVIKDANGNIIFNSMNMNDENAPLLGTNFQNTSYILLLRADSYCTDSGDVFIEVSKTNPNVMSLYLAADIGIINPPKCPDSTTYVTFLPKDKMTLTKQ